LEQGDDGTVKVFGFTHPTLDRVPAPVGENCFHCHEAITESDPGFSQIFVDENESRRIYLHRACFLRQIFGSVAHIEGRCSCAVPGSEDTDPFGMTRREAAEAAVKAYERRNREQ
jgi:hypothetical protein